jgi:hypothetical protein
MTVVLLLLLILAGVAMFLVANGRGAAPVRPRDATNGVEREVAKPSV